MKYILILITLTVSSVTYSQESHLDTYLLDRIKVHNLSVLPKAEKKDPRIVALGRTLFMSNILSGNQNISCMDCHHPQFGSGDGLPFSIGEGGVGVGPMRAQNSAAVTRRNAPHLFNLGYDDVKFMFWDGRVSVNRSDMSYRTPEKALNGSNPQAPHITKALNGALSAQTIFPIADHDEMRGDIGTNEIANAPTNLEAWEKVVDRLKDNNQISKMITAAFKDQDFNIGHVGRALGDFISEEFNFNDTPFDRYMAGDLNALTESQKRGARVFFENGKCIDCHKGRHLGGTNFTSAAVPEIQVEGHPIDKGIYETTKRGRDRYKFVTRSLRNVAVTAPFMHNGSLQTLREVVIHYNRPSTNLAIYQIPENYVSRYEQVMTYDNDLKRNQRRVSVASEAAIKFGLGLSKQEVDDLVEFLEKGLTDYQLHHLLE